MQSNKERTWLLNEKYSGVETPAFRTDLKRLERGEPLAYIIGWVDFLGCRIDLSARPLIPRPETEFWVEQAMAEVTSGQWLVASRKNSLKILDLFAGSGCIGIALLKHLPNAMVDFGEKDPRLCKQIEKNIALNAIDPKRTRVIQTDVFSNITCDLGPPQMDEIRGAGKATRKTYSYMLTEVQGPRNKEVRHLRRSSDYIFANPPYIDPTKKKTVQDSVLLHEPHEALFAGDDGLAFIKKLLAEGSAHLKAGGTMYIEFGAGQKRVISVIAKKHGWKSEFHKDQFGKWRAVMLKK
ncbi:MAG: HemK/PrmC family methyltransferase [bacterium]|nr:HemK/PrmC family methyltransferase [bacterium]